MNFVFFSIILWDWNQGVHQSTQLCRELACRGHRVLFVQPRRSETIDTWNLPIQVVTLEELGLASRLAERAWHGLRVDSLAAVAENLVARLKDLERADEPCVAIWFAPFDPFARLLPVLRSRGYHLLYYPQDDFVGMIPLGFFRANASANDYLGHSVDAIFTLSRPVADKMAGFGKPTHVVPDGINLEEFRASVNLNSPDPPILRGERTLGFWGYLSERMVDPQLVEYVAGQHPEWAINLIGGCENEGDRSFPVERLEQHNNVRFLGNVPHSQLAQYGRLFDACLLPAPENDASRGRDPLKVYEYLALYKPVVCSNMPQLAGMPYVRVAATPEEFLQEIEAVLETRVDPEVIDAYLAGQTWRARAGDFVEILRPLVEQAGPDELAQANAPAGSLVVPSFITPNSGLKVYLDALEKDLAQTRAWAGELEAIVKAKDRELATIYDFAPVRFARWVRARLSAPKR